MAVSREDRQRWRRSHARRLVPFVVALAGCANPPPYRLGIVLGTEGVAGATLALAAVNAGGGVHGRPIELRNLGQSSNSSALPALQVAESLAVDPRVLAVIGHANSSASLSASQVYNARHVVQLAPTTTSPFYSNAGPYSFRLVGSDERQARFLADAVARAAAPRRVALAYVNDDYGRALRRLLVAELARRDVAVALETSYREDEVDGAADLARTIAATRPTILVWLGRASYFAELAAPLRRSLPEATVLASDGFGGTFVESDTLGRFDGIRYVRLVDVKRPDRRLQAVRARFRSAGMGDLSDQAALAYDAVMLLAEAIRGAGADREDIRSWLIGLGRDRAPFPGITGPIAFTPTGDRESEYVLVTAGRASAARAAAGATRR